MKVLKFSAKVVLTVVIFYILYVLTVALSTLAVTEISFKDWQEYQVNNFNNLKQSYEKGTAQRVVEADICDFNLNKAMLDGVTINQLKFLGTHNSYKKGLNGASKMFFNSTFPGMKPHIYDYEFEDITTQLNMGIRSLELDVNIRKNGKDYDFICVHNGLVDANSSIIDLKMGLKEIKMWSDYNPNHLPLTLLIEPKFGLPLTKYKNFDIDYIKALDNMVGEVFGDSLLTNAKLLKDNADYQEFLNNNDYPTLSMAIGKVIVMLHDTQAVQDFTLNVDAKDRNCVSAINSNNLFENEQLRRQTCFVIHNSVTDIKTHNKLESENNYFVRTMVDTYLNYSNEKVNASYKIDANILSTDYPPLSNKKAAHTYTFNNNKTVALNKR